MLLTLILTIIKILGIVVLLLLAVAWFTIAERKIMGAIQRRRGPNVVGYIGLLQPLADGLKLFVKETTLPGSADLGIFLLAPSMAFILSLMGWAVIPYGYGLVLSDLNLGVLFLLAISALNVYSILFAGWSSNSKYPFLGALRSAAQMISYEIALGFCILAVAECAGSYNLSNIVLAQYSMWYIIPLFPVFSIFYISMLAETNRHPFDLPEAESELVSGYNLEYSGMSFALFFLGEYANMLIMSAFSATLFIGGWLSFTGILIFIPETTWFALKICIGVVFFIYARAGLPRFRFDQLMDLGWKTFLPLSLGYLILSIGILVSFNILPN